MKDFCCHFQTTLDGWDALERGGGGGGGRGEGTSKEMTSVRSRSVSISQRDPGGLFGGGRVEEQSMASAYMKAFGFVGLSFQCSRFLGNHLLRFLHLRVIFFCKKSINHREMSTVHKSITINRYQPNKSSLMTTSTVERNRRAEVYQDGVSSRQLIGRSRWPSACASPWPAVEGWALSRRRRCCSGAAAPSLRAGAPPGSAPPLACSTWIPSWGITRQMTVDFKPSPTHWLGRFFVLFCFFLNFFSSSFLRDSYGDIQSDLFLKAVLHSKLWKILWDFWKWLVNLDQVGLG